MIQDQLHIFHAFIYHKKKHISIRYIQHEKLYLAGNR